MKPEQFDWAMSHFTPKDVPPGWRWFQVISGRHFALDECPLGMMRVVGAVAKVATRGPRKGHHVWPRPLEARRLIWISCAAFDAKAAEWEGVRHET